MRCPRGVLSVLQEELESVGRLQSLARLADAGKPPCNRPEYSVFANPPQTAAGFCDGRKSLERVHDDGKGKG